MKIAPVKIQFIPGNTATIKTFFNVIIDQHLGYTFS